MGIKPENQDGPLVAYQSKDLLYFCTHNGIFAILVFMKSPFFFQNSSISLFMGVVMANITTFFGVVHKGRNEITHLYGGVKVRAHQVLSL